MKAPVVVYIAIIYNCGPISSTLGALVMKDLLIKELNKLRDFNLKNFASFHSGREFKIFKNVTDVVKR
jgi:hypothetical protein